MLKQAKASETLILTFPRVELAQTSNLSLKKICFKCDKTVTVQSSAKTFS